jgi:Na+-transporting methylmalonyl-CoA/oxaloacetate decarboxylase gamma subunit
MLTSDSSFMELAFFQLQGLMVVMTTLCCLAIASNLASRVILLFENKSKPGQAPAPAAAPVVAAAGNNQLPEDELFVVIAAAVAATLDRPYRMVSIQPASSSWARAGRTAHHQSHQPR